MIDETRAAALYELAGRILSRRGHNTAEASASLAGALILADSLSDAIVDSLREASTDDDERKIATLLSGFAGMIEKEIERRSSR